MLLRRLMQHARDQNWVAVGLDFVIVVVGVLFALQLSIWAEARSDRAAVAAQLVEFRAGLVANTTEIESLLIELEGVEDAVETLRTALGQDTSEIDPASFHTALMVTIRVPVFDVTLGSRQALADSDWRTLTEDRALVAAITRWDRQLAIVQRLSTDALSHRDGVLLGSWLRSPVSLGATLYQSPRIANAGFSQGRFVSDFNLLAQSREFDGAIGLRFAISAQQAAEARALLELTHELIALLEEIEASK
jgi:hypothetical protein